MAPLSYSITDYAMMSFPPCSGISRQPSGNCPACQHASCITWPQPDSSLKRSRGLPSLKQPDWARRLLFLLRIFRAGEEAGAGPWLRTGSGWRSVGWLLSSREPVSLHTGHTRIQRVWYRIRIWVQHRWEWWPGQLGPLTVCTMCETVPAEKTAQNSSSSWALQLLHCSFSCHNQ